MLIYLVLSDGLDLPTGDDFINKVFPNLWAFLVQLLAFIVMSVIVIKFAYKPVHNYLEKRKKYIADNISSAEEQNQKALEAKKNAEDSLISSNKKALEIIESAKSEAEKQKQEILLEAKKDLEIKRIRAEEDIEKEKQKALQEVHDEVVNLALEASKTLLNREVNSQDNQKLLDEFINDLAEKK